MPCYSNLFQNLLAVTRICKITSINDLNEEGAVNFWLPLSDQSSMERREGAPVIFQCTAQADRQLPVAFNGTHVWPQP